jgi:hypothetical protein
VRRQTIGQTRHGSGGMDVQESWQGNIVGSCRKQNEVATITKVNTGVVSHRQMPSHSPSTIESELERLGGIAPTLAEHFDIVPGSVTHLATQSTLLHLAQFLSQSGAFQVSLLYATV